MWGTLVIAMDVAGDHAKESTTPGGDLMTPDEVDMSVINWLIQEAEEQFSSQKTHSKYGDNKDKKKKARLGDKNANISANTSKL